MPGHRIFRALEILCMTLSIMTDTYHYTFVQTPESILAKVTLLSVTRGLWVVRMCQCSSPTVTHVPSGGGY